MGEEGEGEEGVGTEVGDHRDGDGAQCLGEVLCQWEGEVLGWNDSVDEGVLRESFRLLSPFVRRVEN